MWFILCICDLHMRMVSQKPSMYQWEVVHVSIKHIDGGVAVGSFRAVGQSLQGLHQGHALCRPRQEKDQHKVSRILVLALNDETIIQIDSWETYNGTGSARGFRHKLNKLQLRALQSAGASNTSLKGPTVLSKGPTSFTQLRASPSLIPALGTDLWTVGQSDYNNNVHQCWNITTNHNQKS